MTDPGPLSGQRVLSFKAANDGRSANAAIAALTLPASGAFI
jgi:hypothetical protein